MIIRYLAFRVLFTFSFHAMGNEVEYAVETCSTRDLKAPILHLRLLNSRRAEAATAVEPMLSY